MELQGGFIVYEIYRLILGKTRDPVGYFAMPKLRKGYVGYFLLGLSCARKCQQTIRKFFL
jgi:hypothetical protein